MSHFRKQASQMMMMMVIMMMIIASSSHFWLKQTKKNDLGPKTSAQTYPSQYRSNRSACFLQSQTPLPPYCRGGDPPPTSRRRRSGRRNEAGWPWSYREADGTTLISKHYNNNSIGRICLCQLCPPFRGQSAHWWAARSLPPGWRRRGWHGCGISGYGWCSRSWRVAGKQHVPSTLCNEMRMRWGYSRQDSEGDQSDGEAEDGDGAANITDGCQCHLVAGSELCRRTHAQQRLFSLFHSTQKSHIDS